MVSLKKKFVINGDLIVIGSHLPHVIFPLYLILICHVDCFILFILKCMFFFFESAKFLNVYIEDFCA